MSTTSSNQRWIAIATVLIIALLGVNGYLLYNKLNQDKLIKSQSSELIEAEKLQTELEKEYYQSVSELDEMRSNNQELNALIESQKEELKMQKDRISSLLKTESDLEKARTEMKRMRTMTDQYVAEITKLKDENASLSESNMSLQEEKTQLTQAVESERMVNEELMTARTALVTKTEELEAERDVLSKKVDIASVIRIENIDVQGYKLKSSGKEAFRKNAGVIDGLKICFNAKENQIVNPGNETFYIRVINPLGETQAVEALGSGVLESESTGETIRYTQYKVTEYNNKPTNVCVNWQPDLGFDPGEYSVEIYNKGYLAGSGSFSLK